MGLELLLVGRRAVQDRTVERAFELAASGSFSDLGALLHALRAEGVTTLQTDLRSRILRRELRAMCVRYARRGASGHSDCRSDGQF
jgi:hypothetical protein